VIADGTASLIDFCYAKDAPVDAGTTPEATHLGLGALKFLDDFHPISAVHLITIQPRRAHIGCLAISRADLEAWQENQAARAKRPAPAET